MKNSCHFGSISPFINANAETSNITSLYFELSVTNSGDRENCDLAYTIGWVIVCVFTFILLVVSVFMGLAALSKRQMEKAEETYIQI